MAKWPFLAAIAKKWGQFYALWHHILCRLHLVLRIVIEGWNFACSILMSSSIRIKNTIWDRRSMISIMTSINFKNCEITNWFTPTHSFQNDQTIFNTFSKQIKRAPTKTQIFDLRFDLFSIMLSNMSRSVETKYNVMFSVWFDFIRRILFWKRMLFHPSSSWLPPLHDLLWRSKFIVTENGSS